MRLKVQLRSTRTDTTAMILVAAVTEDPMITPAAGPKEKAAAETVTMIAEASTVAIPVKAMATDLLILSMADSPEPTQIQNRLPTESHLTSTKMPKNSTSEGIINISTEISRDIEIE